MNREATNVNVPRERVVILTPLVALDPVEPNVTKIMTVLDNWLAKTMFALILAGM